MRQAGAQVDDAAGYEFDLAAFAADAQFALCLLYTSDAADE